MSAGYTTSKHKPKTVSAVEAQDFSSTKEDEGNGFCILGCKGHFDNRLPLERLHYQRRVLRQFIELQREIKSMLPGNADKKCSVSPGQCIYAQLFGSPGQITYAQVVVYAICECEFELVDHCPYSPDLAPSDYYLFCSIIKI